MKNFIFFGGKSIGTYILNQLIDDNQIPSSIIFYRDHLGDDIIDKSRKIGIKIYRINKFHEQIEDLIEYIKSENPDFFISVAFQFILPEDILNIVKWPINIHTGAIPKYRGHHPLSAAFLDDEPYQGTTVHLMAKEVDAGKILLQDFIKISNEDDIVSVRNKLTELSYELLKTVLLQLANHCLYSKEQIGEIIWAPKRNPEDSKIDFNNTSRYLHNFIRALVDPYPNAFAKLNGNERNVVRIKKSISSNQPGIVLKEVGENEYIVSTSDGIVCIKTDKRLEIGDKLS